MPWLPKSAGSVNGVPPEKPLRRPPPPIRVDVAELVGRQQVADALDGHGRVEEPEAAAQHRLVALVEALGEADARAEVVLVGVDQRVGQARPRSPIRVRSSAIRPGGSFAATSSLGTTWIPAVGRREVRERPVLLVPRRRRPRSAGRGTASGSGSPSSRPGRTRAMSLECPSSGPRLRDLVAHVARAARAGSR